MAEKLPYFKFYPADFMGSGKVQMMGPLERGIYISLLCQEWQEGPLPDNPTILARVASATPGQMEEAWPLVRRCFSTNEDGDLIHPRLEEEREAALDRRRKAQKAARASARVRRADAQASAQADAPADAGADANTDASADGVTDGGAWDERSGAPDSESHSPRVQSTENSESHNPDGGGLSKLLGYLPEADGLEESIRAIASTSKGSLQRWAIGFLGMYGPTGTRANELRQVDEGERPDVLLDALQAYIAEGQDWDQRFFSGFVRSAVKRHLTGESPDFGDESARDAERRHRARQRATDKQLDQVDEESAKAEAEMAELWDWWEDADDETRSRIKAKAERRCKGVPEHMHRAILTGVIQEHREEQGAAA